MRAAIYVRVSTDKQEVDNQLNQLRPFCSKKTFDVIDEYVDVISGKEKNRPEFDRLFKDAHKAKFDVVVFWSLDRFSRAGTLHTLQKLNELSAHKVDWVSYQEQYINSIGPFSNVVISIMATLAKLEREKISERTKAGLERAKKEGKKLGRPKVSPYHRREIKKLREQGLSYNSICNQLNVSKGTVYNVVNDTGQKRGGLENA